MQRAKFWVIKAQQEKERAIVQAQGEAQSAKLIGEAIQQNPAFITLRKIEAAREVSCQWIPASLVPVYDAYRPKHGCHKAKIPALTGVLLAPRIYRCAIGDDARGDVHARRLPRSLHTPKTGFTCQRTLCSSTLEASRVRLRKSRQAMLNGTCTRGSFLALAEINQFVHRVGNSESRNKFVCISGSQRA